MAQVNETINIGSKADTRGFKQAESAATKLTKTLRNLAGAFGLAYSTTALIKFGKDSVKAFAEDEKAAVRLSKVVDNLGLSFANNQIASFIDELTLASGVSDNELRPAFQALISTTGSLAASQDMLKQAIDIAAGSGENLTTVANDLAQAYVGNTKGLKKYNLGLTKTELAAASFTKIQALLNKQFAGSNEAYLTTYAGKMEKFANAAGEAQEIIGKGLLDALGILGGQGVDDIDAATSSMNKLATATSEAIVGQASFWSQIGSTKGGGILKNVAKAAGLYLSEVLGITASRELGRAALNPATGASTIDNYNMEANAKKIAADKAKAEALAKKRADEILKASKANSAELKKQAALKKAGTIFDLDQVQLLAALKGKLSDEERKRVELQFAIITGNVSEAQKLTYELARAQGFSVAIAKDLASMSFKNNPFASWEAYLDTLLKKAQELAKIGSGGGGGNAAPVIPPLTPEDRTRLLAPVNPNGVSTIGEYIRQLDLAGTSTLPVTPSVGTGQGGSVMENYRLNQIVVQIDGKQVAAALQDSSMSGTSSSVNRLTGGWL
jgi:hypothetical protein